jgi:hypothetical protein
MGAALDRFAGELGCRTAAPGAGDLNWTASVVDAHLQSAFNEQTVQ